MSIRSLDMQVLVQKANEVAKVQHNQQQEIVNRQDEFALDISKQTALISKTVQNANKSEKSMVQEKQEKEKKEKEEEKKRQTSGNSNAANKPQGASSDHKIDILI